MPVKLLIEQLDGLADEEGYIRFDVRDETRRAVIFVNVEYQAPKRGFSQPDPRDEAGNYTCQPPAFSFDETYKGAEIAIIGQAIRNYFYEGQHVFSLQTSLL